MDKLDLDLFKMGYFIVYKNNLGGFIGEAIEETQRHVGFDKKDSRFVHVECSGGGPRSVNIRHPKSTAIDIRDAHAGRYIKLVKFKAYDDAPEKDRFKVAYNSALLCNLPYDWLGVLKFRLRFLSNKKTLPFCSEGCLWSLQGVFKGALGVDPPNCMPADFLNLDWFEVVWEGFIPGAPKKKSPWKILGINRTPGGTKLKHGIMITKTF